MISLKENWVEEKHFKKLQELLFSSNFNWYYADAMVTNPNKSATTKEDSGFWYHNFYFRGDVLSPFYKDYILPTVKHIPNIELYNVRANCMYNPIGSKKVISDWHVDLLDENSTTGILYMNTCNGLTEVDVDTRPNPIHSQESKENTFLSFNSMLKHRAIGQTDCLRRIVINYNFYVSDI